MDPYIGKLLDNRYEILEVIGTGGMARVYKARCHRLNRLVAIKILREDLSQDAEFRRRFHDESQAVAMLSHPNIVAVYDVSRSSEFEYIVMELIDGITLKQYMQKKGNKLNWREALHFITQIVKALGHAHSRGIIHRDIKPHNVMVLRDGSVKVADFGIARVASGRHSTLTQEALGSVHYISPEQARGSHIDARSDLYSAGVVLYEMITGRLPFEGETPVSVAIQHINSIPLSPRELDPAIPEALEAITMKAMAPNPDNRYPNADAMLADLEEFRKNPNINFDYNVGDFPLDEEPEDDAAATQIRPIHHSRLKQEPERKHRREEPVEEEEEEERSRSSPWPIVAAVFVILAFVGGVFFFLYQTFFNSLTQPTETYEVPKLTGYLYEELEQKPGLYENFTLVLENTIASDEPAGTVLSQTPEAGEKVIAAGTEIKVVVSGGPQVIEMIDVTGAEYLKALVELQNMGLKVATPTYEYDEEVAYNHIITYTPLAGTILSPGDVVNLVVSKGPEGKKIPLPDFVGMTQSTAESQIRLRNLIVGEVEPVYDDTVPKGQVMDQYPAPETEVEEGSSVNLVVSLGPDPATQEPQGGGGTGGTGGTGGEGTQEETTKMVTIPLPDTGEIVHVQVTIEGSTTPLFNQDVDTAMNVSVTIPVTGSGSKTYSVYFDGHLSYTDVVNFD